MSKTIHLICNAHLDPIWQWEWEEGAAETLSTFRIAADFCEEYDRFVFCHNEALLYQWIEEYDPELFVRIQRLVKEGKWHIMGGWQLQPDCNMPSGEAFVRQIFAGRKYFLEKFGVVPKVAVNVDPFGHTRGLVQIMKKTGYDAYLFMRPLEETGFINLPANEFRWIGYDGSEVTGIRLQKSYNSPKGQAAEKVRYFLELCDEDDILLCLWGIGNHGGGPSKKDLDDLELLTEEEAKRGNQLIHSTPETYFEALCEKTDLPTWENGLNPWAIGCYTSQVRIKQKYRQAENQFFLCEMMCSHAEFSGLLTYPEQEFAEALHDLMTVQFHDMLPGSSIQPAEEMGLRVLDHALEILSRIRARAFFALSSGQPKAPSDKIPVFAYNPYPYPISGDFTAEFMLWDQNWKQEFLAPQVFAEDGTHLAAQCEKEHSNLPLEWRKRIVFHATLEPMKLNRFECGFQTLPEKPRPTMEHNDTHYLFQTDHLYVAINRKTGLIDHYSKDGIEYVRPGAFALEVFEDNFDPWYMNATAWKNKLGEFTLLSPEEAQLLCHTDSPIEGVHIIESGSVRTVAEAVFGYHTSRAVVQYILSEQTGLQIQLRVIWDEKQRLIKMNIPSAFSVDHCIGDQAYGREILKSGMEENVSQEYIALCGGEEAILAINRGTYGSSFDEKTGDLKLTVLRSPAYTAHPVEDRVVMVQDRYMPYQEQGERDFSFAFMIGKKEELLSSAPRAAQQFNMPPMLLSFYPTGTGTLPTSPVRLSGDVIQLTALKKAEVGEGYILRLFNPTDREETVTLSVFDTSAEIHFGKYEVKTYRFQNETLSEADLLEGLLS